MCDASLHSPVLAQDLLATPEMRTIPQTLLLPLFFVPPCLLERVWQKKLLILPLL